MKYFKDFKFCVLGRGGIFNCGNGDNFGDYLFIYHYYKRTKKAENIFFQIKSFKNYKLCVVF